MWKGGKVCWELQVLKLVEPLRQSRVDKMGKMERCRVKARLQKYRFHQLCLPRGAEEKRTITALRKMGVRSLGLGTATNQQKGKRSQNLCNWNEGSERRMAKTRTGLLVLAGEKREENLPLEPQPMFPVQPTCTSWKQQHGLRLVVQRSERSLKHLLIHKDKILWSWMFLPFPSRLQPSPSAKLPRSSTEL